MSDADFEPGKILEGDPRTEAPWTVGKVFCGFECELPWDIPYGTEWAPWKRQGWYIVYRLTDADIAYRNGLGPPPPHPW